MSDQRSASVPRSSLRWLVALVAVVGTLVALGSFLFPGVVSLVGPDLDGPLGAFATLYPVLGAALAIAALWTLQRTRWAGWRPLGGPDPEAGEAPAAGAGMAEHLRAATAARYLCRTNRSADTIEQRLFEGAVRAVRTERGIDAERAREAVRAGQWTDDRVAAAFLADERGYPLRAWLYGHIDPGGAYQRRVRRTLDAIDATRRPEGDR